jgi:hypothetical protein
MFILFVVGLAQPNVSQSRLSCIVKPTSASGDDQISETAAETIVLNSLTKYKKGDILTYQCAMCSEA